MIAHSLLLFLSLFHPPLSTNAQEIVIDVSTDQFRSSHSPISPLSSSQPTLGNNNGEPAATDCVRCPVPQCSCDGQRGLFCVYFRRSCFECGFYKCVADPMEVAQRQADIEITVQVPPSQQMPQQGVSSGQPWFTQPQQPGAGQPILRPPSDSPALPRRRMNDLDDRRRREGSGGRRIERGRRERRSVPIMDDDWWSGPEEEMHHLSHHGIRDMEGL